MRNPQKARIPVPQHIRGRLAMHGSRGVEQHHRRVIAPADEAAHPGALVDRHQQRLVHIRLRLQIDRRACTARLLMNPLEGCPELQSNESEMYSLCYT